MNVDGRTFQTAAGYFKTALRDLGADGAKPAADKLADIMASARAGVSELVLLPHTAPSALRGRAELGSYAAAHAAKWLEPQYGVDVLRQRIFIPDADLVKNADLARDRLRYALGLAESAV